MDLSLNAVELKNLAEEKCICHARVERCIYQVQVSLFNHQLEDFSLIEEVVNWVPSWPVVDETIEDFKDVVWQSESCEVDFSFFELIEKVLVACQGAKF